MNFYWELTTFDDTVIQIPPNAVETVKRRMDAKEPIHTTTGSIPSNQIKSFRVSEKRYNEQKLIEEAAQAFHEPIITDADGVQARWMKKLVPQQKWDKYYSAIPSYRFLEEMNGLVWVAFRLPVHQIGDVQLDNCSEDEIQRLTQQR